MGLVTDPNEFSVVGDGAMRVFTNGVLKRPNLMQSRRGHTRNATAGASVNKLINYDAGLLAHTANSLKSLAGGVLTTVGTVGAPTPSNGRLRSCIAGKNLYTASTTPNRMSGIAVAPVAAGGLFAPGFDREATVYGAAGSTLTNGFGFAYRYLFGLNDQKGNLHLGEPSGRLIVNNTSGGTVDPTVRAYVPSGATTKHFIQFYRSGAYANGTQPDDDLQLVFEQQLKTTDIAAGYVDLADIVPDGLRGAYIYTAPNAGEGINAANRNPPGCVDVCSHVDRVWYGGTTQPAEFILNILAVGGTAGIQNNDSMFFGGLVGGVFGVAATTGAVGAGQYKLVTGGTASANIEQTAQNLVAAVNKHTSNGEIWAQYISGPQDVPGQILFRGRTPGVPAFTVSVAQFSQRDCFAPQLTPYLIGATFSLTRTLGTTVTATVSSLTQNFKVGEQVLISPGGAGSGGSSFGAGPFTITSVSGTTFVYTEAGTNGTLALQVATLTPLNIATATIEALPNRVYYSKPGEYEATTRNGWLDVGSADTSILAMLSQRGQIWVWKSDGIFRILGVDESDFRVESLDTSIRVRATESIQLFSNRCWGLTDRGVIAVSESGLEVMSEAITDDLRQMMANTAATLERDCFAVPYESEHLYLLFVPPDRDLQSVSGPCRYVYAFQSQTKTWALWDYGATNGKRCGVVGKVDDLLYTGDQYNGLALDSYIYQERKALTSADYQDTTGANVTQGIAKTWTWLLQTEQNPAAEKRWDELEFLFVSGQVAFSLALANELNTVNAFSVASQGTQTARVWVNSEVARGTRLLVTLTHSVAAEAFDLAGIAIAAEVLDGAPTR